MAPVLKPHNDLRTSDAGLALIQRFTPLRSTPEKAACGLEQIGYGHVLRPADQHLTTVSEEQAQHLLREDVRVYEIYLNATVKVPLLQREFDALISLIWDIGILTFEKSAIAKQLNAGMPVAALQSWRYAQAAPNRSTADTRRRRIAEVRMFFLGSFSSHVVPEDERFPRFYPR